MGVGPGRVDGVAFGVGGRRGGTPFASGAVGESALGDEAALDDAVTALDASAGGSASALALSAGEDEAVGAVVSRTSGAEAGPGAAAFVRDVAGDVAAFTPRPTAIPMTASPRIAPTMSPPRPRRGGGGSRKSRE